jgi:hypothetical protein
MKWCTHFGRALRTRWARARRTGRASDQECGCPAHIGRGEATEAARGRPLHWQIGARLRVSYSAKIFQLSLNLSLRQTRKSPGGPPPLASGPRFPVPADSESGNGDSLFPDARRIGNRGFLDSRFRPNRSRIGDSLPDSRPNRESGERDLGTWASQWPVDGTCHEPLAAAAVRRALEPEAGNRHFRGSKATFGPRIVFGTHMG